MSRDPETTERPGATDDHDTAEPRCRRPPVGVETDATRLDGVVLVTCRLHNRTTTPRAVRLRDELPGETLPPRRDGVPERGWDDDTYTAVVPPETTHAVGYASTSDGPLPDTPATLVAVDDPATLVDTDDRVGHARRELADWAPPAEILPQRLVADGGPTDGETSDREAVDGEASDGETSDREAVDGEASDGETSDEGASEDAETANTGTTKDGETGTESGCHSSSAANTVALTPVGGSDDTDRAPFADGAIPTVVAAYLDAAAERIDRAAATAEGVQAATDALRDTHHTPVTLEQAVARDEAALRALAERAATLADRAAAASVPVDSLRRLS